VTDPNKEVQLTDEGLPVGEIPPADGDIADGGEACE
jgi:hypothetical protein